MRPPFSGDPTSPRGHQGNSIAREAPRVNYCPVVECTINLQTNIPVQRVQDVFNVVLKMKPAACIACGVAGWLHKRRGMAAGAVAAALLLALTLLRYDRGPTWVAAAVPKKVFVAYGAYRVPVNPSTVIRGLLQTTAVTGYMRLKTALLLHSRQKRWQTAGKALLRCQAAAQLLSLPPWAMHSSQWIVGRPYSRALSMKTQPAAAV
jgi:hypothetical protein